MNNWIANIGIYLIAAAYFTASLALFIYGLNCYVMLFLQQRKRAGAKSRQQKILQECGDLLSRKDLPTVTIQLPIYNELNVAERIIRSASEIRYPADLLEIQVLDDSTDETSALIKKVVQSIACKNINIKVIQRSNRSGFKAGALANALTSAQGKLIAIFDADFIPPSDFLIQTVPFFLAQKDLGLVQARWGHINSTVSLLTRAQAVGMDGHFMIEQSARSWNDLFMNFNGTAGMWRLEAIEAAGGWQCDTLTEDMDLSYRMQLVGWDTEYLEDVVVPAEIPEDINAFKCQQFRWAKGSIQTAKKLLPTVFASPEPLFKKIQAFMHMTHYLVHPLMLSLSLLSLPVILTLQMPSTRIFYITFAMIMIFATCAPNALYIVSQRLAHKDWLKRILILPFLVIVGVGLAVSNSLAVFQALVGHQSGFIRTPKKGDKEMKVYRVKVPWVTIFEIFLGLYCLVSFRAYLSAGKYLVGPFLAIYSIGFLFVGLLTIHHNLKQHPFFTSSKVNAEKEPMITELVEEHAREFIN